MEKMENQISRQSPVCDRLEIVWKWILLMEIVLEISNL